MVLCLAEIARENHIGETLMRRDKLFAAAQSAHHHPAIAIGLIVEIGMCREQPLRSARRQQRGVKSLVKLVEIRRALVKLVAGSLDVPAHLVQRAENSRFPGIVALRDGEPQRLDLDHRAHPRDIQEVVAADVGHPKTALADSDDQSPGNQSGQAFAQRRGADLVALDQIDNSKARAGRKNAGDDVLLHPVGGAFAQRVRTRHIPRAALRRCCHDFFYFRISLLRSSLVCSIFCDDMISIHQPS